MTTFRREPKPLPVPRWCAVCAQVPHSAAELHAHNLAASDYGERSYGTKR